MAAREVIMAIGNKLSSNIRKLFVYTCFSNLFFERSLFVIFLIHRGFSIAEVALWQSIVNLSMTAGEIPTGVIADKIGKKKALIIGNLLMILYYLFIMFSDSFMEIAAGAFVFGVGSTFISGTEEAFLYDFLDAKSPKRRVLSIWGGFRRLLPYQ